jgi:hypothetical protein
MVPRVWAITGTAFTKPSNRQAKPKHLEIGFVQVFIAYLPAVLDSNVASCNAATTPHIVVPDTRTVRR